NAHSNQSSCQAANCAARACASQCRHYGPSRDERSQARYGQGANSRQPSQASPNDCARGSAGRGTFRCFGVFLVGKILCALVLWEEHRDVCVKTIRCPQSVNRIFNAYAVAVNSESCCIFTCHSLNLL